MEGMGPLGGTSGAKVFSRVERVDPPVDLHEKSCFASFPSEAE